MATSNRYRVPFKRRGTGQTNYKKRRELLKSGLPRAVVRKTNRSMIVEVMEYDPAGDRVIAYAETGHIRKLGWNGETINTAAAYLTGYLAGKRLIAKGIETCILDIGLRHPTKGARIFSALSGLIDAGVNVPHNPEILPEEERIVSCSEKVSQEEFEKIKNAIDSEVA